MPIVIGIGVLAVVGLGIFLFSGPALASSSGSSSGSRTGGTPDKKSGIKVVIKAPSVEVPPAPVIKPIPTPGAYYRIVEDDIGSEICVRAYGVERPTARWLHVAAHPANRVRLGATWPNWFLPRWHASPAPQFSEWAGTHTGEYAVIWLPLASEVAV